MQRNATDLFELSKESEQEFFLPCSESFWTVVLTLFLLEHAAQIGSIRVWRYKKDERPCLTNVPEHTLEVRGLLASHITVEPSTVSHMNHFKTLPNDSTSEDIARWSGFRPDLVIRRPLNGRPKYTFIEVKTGSISSASQIENYPALISNLSQLGIPCELLFLCSVGSRALDTSILALQASSDLSGRFGVLLWEEVFLKMADAGFQPFGNEINWRRYAEDAYRSHCQPISRSLGERV
jgi:hypothetical protein